jgi:hypothetical protein
VLTFDGDDDVVVAEIPKGCAGPSAPVSNASSSPEDGQVDVRLMHEVARPCSSSAPARD